MSLKCQNGWPASEDRAELGIQNFVVPGTQVKVALRGDVAPLFLEFARWWNEEVEELVPGTCWGYAFRNVRGGEDLSNHAGGGGLDLNAPQHPLGATGTLGSKKPQVIAKAASLGLRSGAGYKGRKDEMHVEGNVPLAQAIVLANKLQAPSPRGQLVVAKGVRPLLELRSPLMSDGGPTGPIHDFQRVAGDWYPNAQVVEDGIFGKQSKALAEYVQRMNGLLVDGKVGEQTYRALRML